MQGTADCRGFAGAAWPGLQGTAAPGSGCVCPVWPPVTARRAAAGPSAHRPRLFVWRQFRKLAAAHLNHPGPGCSTAALQHGEARLPQRAEPLRRQDDAAGAERGRGVGRGQHLPRHPPRHRVPAGGLLQCCSAAGGDVMLQDQWMGDTPQSKGPGNFGLWRWCSDR